MRYLVGSLGLALVVVGLVFWLVPIGESKTTVLQTSTTRVSGDTPSVARQTVVRSRNVTSEPRERGSDAVVGVLVGTGALLFLAFAFWGRITEIGLPGGASIKVKDAEASAAFVDDAAIAIRQELLPAPGVAAPGVPAPSVAQLMKDSSIHIVNKTKKLVVTKERVVVVGLGAGDKWLLPNLYFLAYLLRQWTSVSVLVFTESTSSTDALYAACASPQALRDRLEEVQPELTRARAATATTSLDQAGFVFFGQLETQASTQAVPQEVTGALLRELAGDALTTTSVEVKSRDELKATELRAILNFPHDYVPVTQARVLVATVDQNQVALLLSRSLAR